jgi:hypothetical protein
LLGEISNHFDWDFELIIHLNPIERMWSKVKALLHKAEVRTNEALLLAIGGALSQVTQKDAAHGFAHFG